MTDVLLTIIQPSINHSTVNQHYCMTDHHSHQCTTCKHLYIVWITSKTRSWLDSNHSCC